MKKNTAHDLKFNSVFCKEFEAWNAYSSPADKEQVSLDIVRLGETGKIFFKKNGVAESIFDGLSVEEDIDKYKEKCNEIFFSNLKAFPVPFQNFINQHFHQGGELYSGIRYLDVLLLSSIGFQSTGTTREFVFEQEENQLFVEEIFRVKGLMFSPLHDYSFSFDSELKEEVFFPLDEAEKAKLEFLRKELEAVYSKGDLVECRLSQEKNGAPSITIEDMSETLFAEKFAANESALMTFSVRHRVVLDKCAVDGIHRQAFTEDDFSATVHETLLPNNYTNNFSNLFSPKLTVSLWKPGYFKNVGIKEQYSNLIIGGYHNFILLMLSMVFNFINRPIVGLSSAATEERKRETDFAASFSQRMRA